jgi:hypothetical protein
MSTFEENHAALPAALGKVVANLLSLELLLRTHLSKVDGTDFVDKNPHAASGGDWVNETALTDFRPLSKIIERYNELAVKHGAPDISADIVALRNAIAHGRLGTIGDGDHFHLIKYSSPKAGKVRIEFNQQLSAQWFDKANEQVRDAILKVVEYTNRIFPGSTLLG